MENCRAVKILAIAAAASAVLLLIFAPQAFAYNNVNAHPTINEYAYDRFVNLYMPYDQYLKSANLEAGMVRGEAWDQEDGGTWHDRISPETREKSIWQWLSDSGFSADEPEIDMALIHFYDPVRTPDYLTDNVNDVPGGAYVNPEISAYDWAFTDDNNPFGFENGKLYYQSALAGTDPDTLNYGKAWRSVGETMHLISDMTIPAHVRNDGHIPYARLWDPLEYYTDATDVQMYGLLYDGSTSLGNYHSAYTSDTDIRTLFRNEAKWTSEHFFSADTVPLYGKTTTYNGQPQYSSPTVTWSPSFTGYITTTVDGRKLNLTRQSLAGIIWKTPYLVVDQNVCNDQRSILIPTAIRSSAAVLDAFLPRFKVVIDSVKPDEEDPDYYVVTAHIQHIVTREWPDDLTIRNGAFLSVEDNDYMINIDDNQASDDSLNKIKVTVEAETDDVIQVYYNLGGYGVFSGTYRIPEVSPTPTPQPAATPGPATDYTSSGVPMPWLNGNYIQSSVSHYDNGAIRSDFWYSKDIGGDDTYDVSYYDDPNVVTSVHHLYHHGSVYEEWIKEYDWYGNLVTHQVAGAEGGWHYVVGTPAPVGSNPATYR